MSNDPILVIAIAALALLGIIIRPRRINEAWWAAAGALAILATGALSPPEALRVLRGGTDVLLFLGGMTALAAFARSEGVFTYAAALAVNAAHGSRMRLFAIIYVVGVLTTALLSNDAAIVVLTPAVIAATRAARITPAPFVFACALVANAASTLLPIANPANLLFYPGHVPRLDAWIAEFGIASLAAIVVTYAVLARIFRKDLRGDLPPATALPDAPRTLAVAGLALAALALVIVASSGGPIGATAAILGLCALAAGQTRARDAAAAIVRETGWSVIIMTAGLFVIFAALDRIGAAGLTSALFAWASTLPSGGAPVAVAVTTALTSNVLTNLPVGIELGRHIATLHPPSALAAAALAGVDLGPNLSVNGSLATFLWLAVLRRGDVRISAWRFAAVGVLVTPPAVILAALLVR